MVVEVSVIVVTAAVAVPETLVFGYSTIDGITSSNYRNSKEKTN